MNNRETMREESKGSSEQLLIAKRKRGEFGFQTRDKMERFDRNVTHVIEREVQCTDYDLYGLLEIGNQWEVQGNRRETRDIMIQGEAVFHSLDKMGNLEATVIVGAHGTARRSGN